MYAAARRPAHLHRAILFEPDKPDKKCQADQFLFCTAPRDVGFVGLKTNNAIASAISQPGRLPYDRGAAINLDLPFPPPTSILTGHSGNVRAKRECEE